MNIWYWIDKMEVLLRVAAFLLKCVGFILMPFLSFFNSYKKFKIPPIKNDLINLSVVDLAQKIRKKEVNKPERVTIWIQNTVRVNWSRCEKISSQLFASVFIQQQQKFNLYLSSFREHTRTYHSDIFWSFVVCFYFSSPGNIRRSSSGLHWTYQRGQSYNQCCGRRSIWGCNRRCKTCRSTDCNYFRISIDYKLSDYRCSIHRQRELLAQRQVQSRFI